MTTEISLLVNEVPIALDYFVQGFIDHTIGGILASLEGTGKIENVTLSINGETVEIKLNNAAVPIKPFVCKIISNTVLGMVSSLKGVSEIDKVNISIKR